MFIPEPPAGITDPAVIAQYDLNGRSTSGAADYAFNVGFDYTAMVRDNMEWGFGVNTSFTDEYQTQNEERKRKTVQIKLVQIAKNC